jgi:hypothetical protein
MLLILLALLVLSHVSFFATAARLQTKHRSVFDRMEFDGMLFNGSFDQLGRLLMFVLKGEHTRLKDTFLTITGYLFAVTFVITLPALLMYLFLRI